MKDIAFELLLNFRHHLTMISRSASLYESGKLKAIGLWEFLFYFQSQSHSMHVHAVCISLSSHINMESKSYIVCIF